MVSRTAAASENRSRRAWISRTVGSEMRWGTNDPLPWLPNLGPASVIAAPLDSPCPSSSRARISTWKFSSSSTSRPPCLARYRQYRCHRESSLIGSRSRRDGDAERLEHGAGEAGEVLDLGLELGPPLGGQPVETGPPIVLRYAPVRHQP